MILLIYLLGRYHDTLSLSLKSVKYIKMGEWEQAKKCEMRKLALLENKYVFMGLKDFFHKLTEYDCHYNLSLCHLMLGEYQESIKEIRKIFKIDGHTLESIYKGELDILKLLQDRYPQKQPENRLLQSYTRLKNRIVNFAIPGTLKGKYPLLTLFSAFFAIYALVILICGLDGTSYYFKKDYTTGIQFISMWIFFGILLFLPYFITRFSSSEVEREYSRNAFDHPESNENWNPSSSLPGLLKAYKLFMLTLPVCSLFYAVQCTEWFNVLVPLMFAELNADYLYIAGMIFLSFSFFVHFLLVLSIMDYLAYFITRPLNENLALKWLVELSFLIMAFLPGLIFLFLTVFLTTFLEGASYSYNSVLAFSIFDLAEYGPNNPVHILPHFFLTILVYLIFSGFLYEQLKFMANKQAGDYYYGAGKYAEASERYGLVENQLSGKLYTKIHPFPPPFFLRYYLAYGDSKFRAGKPESQRISENRRILEASALLDKALSYAQEFPNSYLWKIFYTKGLLEAETQNLRRSYENYKKAIDAIENLRGSIKIPERRGDFFENKIEVYKKMVSTCLELEKYEEAFEYAEKAKGRVFLDMLDSAKLNLKASPELKEKEAEYVRKIKELQLKGGTRTRMGALDSELEGVCKEYDEFLLKIKEEDPEYYAIKTSGVTNIETVQRCLEENEVVLEFFIAEKAILFIIQKENFKVKVLPTAVDTLHEKIVDFRKRIEAERMELRKHEAEKEEESKTDSTGSGSETGSKEGQEKKKLRRLKFVARDLYRDLVKPWEDELQSGPCDDLACVESVCDESVYDELASNELACSELASRELIIIPHGILHYLPFNALHDGKKWFIEKYEIRFLQNASILELLAKKKVNSQKALVVGNPTSNLEYAESEALSIAEKLNTKALIRDEATKTSVLEELGKKGIIHLACHAKFIEKASRLSHLVFADGNLFVTEIYNLELETDLVALSACESGLGSLDNGDEVESMTRAFMRAGAQTVISSLWSAYDKSTESLFLIFYEKEGSKVRRLRESQLDLMETYEHPYYWALFELFGEK
ncbi:MAG: CHAT domain-containing protein [Methanosarcinaceae archaeon]|uniref:CHAT domain-containing protein n=1 Tax=Methanosarcina sp. MTP4 TaxID=1434100 RepID=UPI0018CDD36A|nr:CHAT domain-containing protein [Methanosarcina sp. MTP4]